MNYFLDSIYKNLSALEKPSKASGEDVDAGQPFNTSYIAGWLEALKETNVRQNHHMFQAFKDFVWDLAFSRKAEKDFQEEIMKKAKYMTSKSSYTDAFNYFLNAILPLNPDDLEFKVTVSDSLRFRFTLEDNLVFRIECFLEDITEFKNDLDNTILTIEKDLVQEYGLHGSPGEVVEKLYEQIPTLFDSLDVSGYETHLPDSELYGMASSA